MFAQLRLECSQLLSFWFNYIISPPLCSVRLNKFLIVIIYFYVLHWHVSLSLAMELELAASAHVPVLTALNLNKWSQILHNYHETDILDFLTYGFPLGFLSDAPPQPEKPPFCRPTHSRSSDVLWHGNTSQSAARAVCLWPLLRMVPFLRGDESRKENVV